MRSVLLGAAVIGGIVFCAEDAPAPFELRGEETIVFFGDSITAGGLYTVYLESYLLTRFPEKSFRCINSGRGSETLSGLSEVDHPGPRPNAHARFERDVAAYSPTLLISCFGINDGIYHPFSSERFEAFQNGVRKLIERVRTETKARLVICTPPPYDSFNPGQPDVRPAETYGYKRPFADYDRVLDKYSLWLLTLPKTDATVVDIHGPMQEHLRKRREENAKFRVQGDGIHPDATGHILMAAAILKGLGLPALADEAEVDARRLKAPAGRVGNIALATHGAVGEWILEFDWTSNLPMPMDERWDAKSVALEKLGETVNRHRLKVTGLSQPRYQLTADGKPVAQLSREDLQNGVNLLALEQFPTTARSREVLPLIQQRRKLGFESFRKQDAPPNPQRAELDAKLKELCTPRAIKIRLEEAK